MILPTHPPTYGAKVEPATVNVKPAGTGAKITGPAATKKKKPAIENKNSVYLNGPAAYFHKNN